MSRPRGRDIDRHGIGGLQAGRGLHAHAHAVRRAVGALDRDLHVTVVEDPDVAGGEADARRHALECPGTGGRSRWAASGRSRGQEQDAAAKNGTRYRTLPVIAKCARRFRAQQVSLDSWQSGISLPYDTVFSRSAPTPSETR